MTIKRMTPQQRAVYALVRRGSVDITLDNARPLHALKRRGLVRFARDVFGVKVARLRDNRATKRRIRRMKADDSMYHALAEGCFIPLIEGVT
jgi:hypothetical protein